MSIALSIAAGSRPRRVLVLVSALAIAPLAAASAQTSARTLATCKADTTAEWYRNQKAFYTNPGETWTNDSMRVALLNAAGYDARAAFVPELGWRLDLPSGGGQDAGALDMLRAMASRRQWPTRAMVGVAGVHAAWLIAQRDSALQNAAMHRMMEAGPGESSPAEVAVLEDARRIKIGRGQIHGSQFRMESGTLVLAGKLEDSVHVDMRREGAWLPPIAVSACLARAAGR
jgi:hypothetical protein